MATSATVFDDLPDTGPSSAASATVFDDLPDTVYTGTGDESPPRNQNPAPIAGVPAPYKNAQGEWGSDSPSMLGTFWKALTTPESPQQEAAQGMPRPRTESAIHNVGGRALNTAVSAVQSLAHPLNTYGGMVKVMSPGPDNPITQRVAEFENEGGVKSPEADENLAGDAAGLYLGGKAIGEVAKSPAVQDALGASADAIERGRQWLRPTTSTAVVPADRQLAATTARAINPPGGVTPGLEEAITNQAPLIKAYAQRTANPLNTRWELAKAAAGHANELNDFYDHNVLGPSAGKPVSIEGTGYKGQLSAPGKATLGEIDARLSELNNLLRPAYGKISEGAQMTALERSGYEGEVKALRGTLYRALSQETGLTPDEVHDLRQSFGQSYDIASQADAARRKTPPGGAGIPTSRAGIVASAIEHLPGASNDAISDRRVRSAFQRFQPAISPVEDMRNRISNYRSQSAATAAENQAAAQQEVLRAHDQAQTQERIAAQKTAAQRATAQRTAANQAAAQQEVLHAHSLDNAAQGAAAQRAKVAAGERDALANQTGARTDSANPYRDQMEEYINSGSPVSFESWLEQQDEPAPLSEEDEMRHRVGNINDAVKPNTHDFSIGKWSEANPKDDPIEARKEAIGLGYRIVR